VKKEQAQTELHAQKSELERTDRNLDCWQEAHARSNYQKAKEEFRKKYPESEI